MQKSHLLLGCQAIGINSSLIFLKYFPFFKFTIPNQKPANIFIDWSCFDYTGNQGYGFNYNEIKTICLTLDKNLSK